MRYWWVNQNQTYKQETAGSYLWSPKRNANGAKNQFYENMREVSPGDLVFSFRDTTIPSLGVAVSNCYESPKPDEFGLRGQNWSKFGWKVDVLYKKMASPIRPKDHIDRIRPHLPAKYSPLQQDGDGLQSVYLAEISSEFALVLKSLLAEKGNDLSLPDQQHDSAGQRYVADEVEDRIESQILELPGIDLTEKEQLVKARRGQGRFRENVCRFERRCRVCGVDDLRFLIASHIKPWRHSTDPERLDGENGLLLSPNVDRLFDQGFISFASDGTLLISDVIPCNTLEKLGISSNHVYETGPFTEKQKHYLSFHRREVFLKAGCDS